MEVPHATTLLVFGSIAFLNKLDHNFKWELKTYKNLYGSINIMNFEFEIDKQTHKNIDASTYFVMWVNERLKFMSLDSHKEE